jgi:hypothetical protein
VTTIDRPDAQVAKAGTGSYQQGGYSDERGQGTEIIRNTLVQVVAAVCIAGITASSSEPEAEHQTLLAP